MVFIVFRMNVSIADYDAAEALLDLQSTWKQESPRPCKC